jgi:cytochrome c-type biogenesis protein CcmH/NrfG
MSPVTSPLTEFERNARAVLEESLARVDGRTRSRLNQARQLAVESVGMRHRPRWRTFALMPAGAVAAALVLAVMLWHHEPTVRESPAAVEDMDLLADADGLELVEGWDGPFYEWAADQTDGNVQSDS